MRITLKAASEFADKHGCMTHNAIRYLDLADGNEELAVMIRDYYKGDGTVKNYTVGQVIRDFWLREGHKDG